MSGIPQIYDRDNIHRAWRWIRSNPDALYKCYFRDAYANFAIADQDLLEDLRDRVRRGIFEPRHSCKLYFPKPSGILRPYSLLSIEDQIAYQAAANVIADKLFPKVRHRYYREVFGHLYAGKSSVWFYRKWSSGYAKFNEAIKGAYKDGYIYAATFDLTACYDSLDHGVMKHFLGKLGLTTEFASLLIAWLNKWTATNHRIYHDHGIPQGPLSSGILSEVVLQHFDANRGRQSTVKYFRYVDDIKLYAKSEKNLRAMLVRLDELSKDIGLFPQSAKISIHKVEDINDEIKTVSNPVEPVLKAKLVDQSKLRKRIQELSPRFEIKNVTRFKYLLAHAMPESHLTKRLWRIFERYPELYRNLVGYLAKYDQLPRKASEKVIREIRAQNLYQSIPAALVSLLKGRVSPKLEGDAKKAVANRWRPRTSMQPDFYAAVAQWHIHYDQFTFSQMETSCLSDKAWWSRAQVCAELNDRQIGAPSLATLANKLIRDESVDVAINAAALINRFSLDVDPPRRSINRAAAKVLKSLGIISRGPGRACAVAESMKRMAGVGSTVNWKRFFGPDYKHAERQAVMCRSLADTNVTAWVNAFDVFVDQILIALYRHDPSLGSYTPGSVGSVMNSSRLATTYPNISALVNLIHQKRYESSLSHAKQRRTGKATSLIKYPFLTKSKPLIRSAVSELASNW